MSDTLEILKWGDIVRLHGVSKTNMVVPNGLIITKGFTDPNVSYQTYENFSQVNFYRKSLFQIIPSSNFDLHDQLLDENIRASVQQKQRLKERVKSQIELLNKQFKAKEGTIIVYGAEVIFKHIQSQQYLSGVLKAADIGEGAFKLQISKNLSSHVIFKINSHRSYQHDDDQVYYNDALQLYNRSLDCYTNIDQTETPIYLDTHYQICEYQGNQQGYKYAENRPTIKRPINKRISVINENKSKCLWKFIKHCQGDTYKQLNKIKSHDIVYFQHTKNNGLIASTLAHLRYYLKEYAECYHQEEPSYECFWELIPKEVNQLGPQSCNLFWARNIVTGQILSHQGFMLQIKSEEAIEGGGFRNDGLISLICDEKGSKIQRGERIAIDLSIPKIIQYFDEKIIKYELESVKDLKKDSFKIYKVDEDTIHDVAYVLSSQQNLIKLTQIISTELINQNRNKTEFTQMFRNLNQNQLDTIINILKMLSCKIYGVEEFYQIEQSGNTPINKIQQILVQTGITEILIQILYTLYQPFKFINNNINSASQDRSIRNRIFEIFACSYSLLAKIAQDCQENRMFLSRFIDLFLEHSKNINYEFIQQCLIGIMSNNPVSIEATITEDIIKQLIQCFRQEMQNLIANQFLTCKYLKLFSTFILCKHKVIKSSQYIILNNFFIDEQNYNLNFQFKVDYQSQHLNFNLEEEEQMKFKTKIIKVSFGGDKYYSLLQFFNQHQSKINYLIAYINLLADLCKDRNNEAIEVVQNIISLAVVTAVLFNDEVAQLNKQMKRMNSQSISKGQGIIFPHANLHEPFIRIAHYTYVDNCKFSPIKRIKKISRWYRFEDCDRIQNQDINKTKRIYEGQKQQEQKLFLKSLLIYIKQFLQNCNQEPENLQILYNVLKFLQKTVILGLWQHIEDFHNIIPLLIMKITKIVGTNLFKVDQQTMKKMTTRQYVDLNKQKLQMNRPQIVLDIQCKIAATQIFKYMNQMEIDIRLRYVMNFFQGLYETIENFEIYNQSFQEILPQDISEEQCMRNQIVKEEFLKVQGNKILGQVKMISQDEDIMLKSNIWYHKLKSMIPLEQQTTDRNFNLVVMALFEVSAYKDKNLLNSSISVLRAIFEQRNDLISNFNAILICGKGNLYQVYLTLKYMRNKFNILQNQSILKFDGQANKSFPYSIWKPYDHLGRQQAKRAGIIQDLFFLARTLKDGVSLKNIESLMYVQKGVFKQNIVYPFINQREKNNQLFQGLNLAEGVYMPLIKYIKIVGNCEFSEIHRWLLFSIYQYLTVLCFNNIQVKQVFMQYIPDILPHLSKGVGASNFLYEVCNNNKILVNNQPLITEIIEKALTACNLMQDVKISIEEQSKDPYLDIYSVLSYDKSKVLSSLRGIVIFNEQGHKNNQEILMNKLQDNKYRGLVFNGRLNFKAKKEDFNLSSVQTYAAAHFQLLSALVESENLINIGKLQNLHPYAYCLENLQNTNRWQIRRALRAYVNRLYYVNKDRDIFLFEEFIRKQFRIINKQLYDVIELHRSKMLTQDLKIKNGARFIYAQSEIIFMIIQILVTLHEMFLKPEFVKLLKKQIEKQKKKTEVPKQIHDSMIRLLKNLGLIFKLYPTTKPIFSFIKEIKDELLIPILITFNIHYLEKKSQPQQDANNQDLKEEDILEGQVLNTSALKPSYDHSKSFFKNLVEMIRSLKAIEVNEKLKEQAVQRKNQMNMSETELKKKYITVIFQAEKQKLKPFKIKKTANQKETHYKPHLQTAQSQLFKVLAKPQLAQNQQNIELNRRLQAVKKLMQQSPMFQKLRADQFYKLVNIFTNIDQISKQYYNQEWTMLKQNPQPVFSAHEILKNTFNLIMKYPESITDTQKIFIIKLARCYISQAVEHKQNYKMVVDKWNADYYSDDTSGLEEDTSEKERSQFVKRQHKLEECGGSDFLISILKQNLAGRVQLLNQVLMLGIIYLYNGNVKCQNSILSSLKQDVHNQMLINIKNIIKNIGNFLIEVRKIKDYEKIRNFNYKIVDSYDYFDMKEGILTKQFGHKANDKMQLQKQIDDQLALRRIFRFLQLFCENNNIEMKIFLLTQTNTDEMKKTCSVNFIEEACLLLRKLFKVINSKFVTIPPSILDFITEITQIPCIDNQISLMKSTFFEDVSFMAEFFESKENIQQRKFNLVPNDNDSNSDPFNQLAENYQKAVQLALSNFQGNDSLIIWEFLCKCRPHFLWIVMKKNIVKILKEKAQFWQISRESLESRVMEKSNEYREFLLEQQFIKELLINFNENKIKALIEEENGKDKVFRQEICNIINILAILRKIDDYAADREKQALKDKENPNEEENLKALKARTFKIKLLQSGNQYIHLAQFMVLFEQLVLSIEICSYNGRTESFQNIYFPRHPVFNYLADDTRDNIMMQVTRDTPRDRLISLLQFQQDVKNQIQWNYEMNFYILKIASKELPLSITSDYCNIIRKTARNISCLICLLMLLLILVDHDTTQQVSYFTFYSYSHQMIMRIICSVQLILTLLFLTCWLKMRWKLCLQKYMNEEQSLQPQLQSEQEEQDDPQTVLQKLTKRVVNYLLLIHEFFKKIWQLFLDHGWAKLKKTKYGEKLVLLLEFVKMLLHSVAALYKYESGFLSIFIFISVSFMGNFVGIEWFTVHIFDIFVSISLLTNVFKAILQNLKLLTLLSMLAGCFILVFNILSLNTYAGVIYKQDTPDEACESIIGCVLKLYTSGAIGDDMDKISIGRLFFDTLYVVFMEMLFQNMVGGIMIDAFTALMDEDACRIEDKKNNCYICSMTTADIQKNGSTFPKHTSKHFIWNYIFYIYCLKMKDPTDYTGIQYSITTKIESDDVTWFPDNSKKQTASNEELVQKLKTKISHLQNKTDSLVLRNNKDVGNISKKILKAMQINKKFKGSVLK